MSPKLGRMRIPPARGQREQRVGKRAPRALAAARVLALGRAVPVARISIRGKDTQAKRWEWVVICGVRHRTVENGTGVVHADATPVSFFRPQDLPSFQNHLKKFESTNVKKTDVAGTAGSRGDESPALREVRPMKRAGQEDHVNLSWKESNRQSLHRTVRAKTHATR